MSGKIVQLNEEVIKELVRGSVEETLNELPEKEAEQLTQAARYERNKARQGYRSGHCDRKLVTTSGDVTLHVPRLKGVSFASSGTAAGKVTWRKRSSRCTSRGGGAPCGGYHGGAVGQQGVAIHHQ